MKTAFNIRADQRKSIHHGHSTIGISASSILRLVTQSILGLAIVFGTATSASAQGIPEVGAAYPDFVLPSIDDQRPVRLSDFRGKKVLLIHFASW